MASRELVGEAMLEMHYHSALYALFEAHFGAKVVRIYKPSPRREVWLGFDQAWTAAPVSQGEFFDEIEEGSKAPVGPSSDFYATYFLQFKVVHEIRRRDKHYPKGWGVPFYRAELETERRNGRSKSQHEVLVDLQKRLKPVEVSYACPMLHDPEQLTQPADLDTLRIVPISGAPGGWKPARHFICFQTQAGAEVWLSQPSKAEALSPREWIVSEGAVVRRTVSDTRDFLERVRLRGDETEDGAQNLPSSLRVVRMREVPPPTAEAPDLSRVTRGSRTLDF